MTTLRQIAVINFNNNRHKESNDMKTKNLFLISLLALSTSALAGQKTVCTSQPNQSGGTESITIEERGTQTLISGFAQGGRAHFVTQFGPFVATEKREGDAVIFTFNDDNQDAEVTIITTILKGKMSRTASTSYGLWQDSVMICK